MSFPPFPCAALGEHKKPSGCPRPIYLVEGGAATVMP